MKEISNDLKFIKEFSKLSVNKVCKDLKINLSNLLSNRSSEKNIILVKTEIIKRVLSLLDDSYKN